MIAIASGYPIDRVNTMTAPRKERSLFCENSMHRQIAEQPCSTIACRHSTRPAARGAEDRGANAPAISPPRKGELSVTAPDRTREQVGARRHSTQRLEDACRITRGGPIKESKALLLEHV